MPTWAPCPLPHGPSPGGAALGGKPFGGRGLVLFTVRRPPPLPFPTFLAHPRCLVLGIGCNRNTPTEEIRREVWGFLEEEGFARESLLKLATAELKRDEVGLLAFAEEAGLPWPSTPGKR